MREINRYLKIHLQLYLKEQSKSYKMHKKISSLAQLAFFLKCNITAQVTRGFQTRNS